MLVVDVVDCVYSLPKKQVGWVNGNPYYGDFHVHPSTGVKMVGSLYMYPLLMLRYIIPKKKVWDYLHLSHTLQQNNAIEQSTLPESNVSDTTSTSEINTSDTPSMDQTQQTPHNQLNNLTLLLLLTILVLLGLLDQVGAEDPAVAVMEEDTNARRKLTTTHLKILYFK